MQARKENFNKTNTSHPNGKAPPYVNIILPCFVLHWKLVTARALDCFYRQKHFSAQSVCTRGAFADESVEEQWQLSRLAVKWGTGDGRRITFQLLKEEKVNIITISKQSGCFSSKLAGHLITAKKRMCVRQTQPTNQPSSSKTKTTAEC